jgi:hypothetical protein
MAHQVLFASLNHGGVTVAGSWCPEFAALVAAQAAARCAADQPRRAKLTGDDVLDALCELGFDEVWCDRRNKLGRFFGGGV